MSNECCNTVILLALINIMLIGSTSPSFYHKSVLDTDELYFFFQRKVKYIIYNKLTIFHTFIILSNFNFCPLAWHFCTEKNSKKIEKVQERALRFVYEDYNSSYDNLLKKAKVPSLQIRRMRTMALETFKIMNKLSPSCLHSLVHLRNSKYYFRYNNILDIPQVRTSRYGKKTFKFAAATLWNSLPDHFRTENSFSQFKSLMQSWNGTKCCCSACR